MTTTLRVILLGALVAGPVLAQEIDAPLRNWTVPPYTQAAAGAGGVTPMTDATPPRAFIGVQPCRLVDTRNPAGPHGGPPLAAHVVRTFDLDNGPCPGIPAGVDAYSLNFGGILPPADGFLTAWPTGSAQPVVSQLNLLGGEVAANAAIVPASLSGEINVLVNVGPTHIYIDINGYFAETPGSPSNGLRLTTNGIGPTIAARNHSTTCEGTCGIGATSSSGTAISGTVTDGPSLRAGVEGRLVDGLGNSVAEGRLATNYGADAFFGYEGPPWAVFGQGHVGASGSKYFLDPHPTDASKVIGYIALEGPEAGTYFRGRTRFQRGLATISVPEDFRLVTDADGLTVQITPIGEMATFAVVRMGLDEIVVKASRDVEFSFLVQGVRATSDGRPPIFKDGMFVPERAGSRMPEWLTARQKQRLIRNGTYREDGTVNLETARRNGWDRVWAEREKQAPRPLPE